MIQFWGLYSLLDEAFVTTSIPYIDCHLLSTEHPNYIFLCLTRSPCMSQVLPPPAGYVPIRTPARKLLATPTPVAGTPMGFRMQTPDNKSSKDMVVDMQPKGNLPMMKPDDMQYFDKLLVRLVPCLAGSLLYSLIT